MYFLVILLLFIVACEPTLNDKLDGVRIAPYLVERFSSYKNAENSTFNWTEVMSTNELNDVILELRYMKPLGEFESLGRDCFYDNQRIVCFYNNKIVNFLKFDGLYQARWNIRAYDFDFNRTNILKKDLKSCKIDSDCVLTKEQVCEEGCYASINKNQAFILSQTTGQCLQGKCGEEVQPVCLKGLCQAKVSDTNVIKFD